VPIVLFEMPHFFGICRCAGRWWAIPTTVERIKLPESEGVRENEFYWQFQLTLRNNWNNVRELWRGVIRKSKRLLRQIGFALHVGKGGGRQQQRQLLILVVYFGFMFCSFTTLLTIHLNTFD